MLAIHKPTPKKHNRKKINGNERKKLMNENTEWEWMNVKARHTQNNFYTHGAVRLCNDCFIYFFVRVCYYCRFCRCFVTASNRIYVGGYYRYNRFGRGWCWYGLRELCHDLMSLLMFYKSISLINVENIHNLDHHQI